MHSKGQDNGYALNLGSKNVYASGDTEYIAEMRAIKSIEVAFVSVNLRCTANGQQAAQGVLAFRPGIIHPYNYWGKNGLCGRRSV